MGHILASRIQNLGYCVYTCLRFSLYMNIYMPIYIVIEAGPDYTKDIFESNKKHLEYISLYS